MVSRSLRHFPPVLFQNNERVLWNPVQRKPLVNRPEERVRLRVLDWLLLDLKWSRTRIAIESTLPSTSNQEKFRADLVCYTKNLEPSVLIECKADTVRLDESVALQIARYNRSLMAPHLCVTNGLKDYWFQIREGRPVPNTDPESLADIFSHSDADLQVRSKPEYREADYWQSHGFTGSNLSPDSADTMSSVLNRFWEDDQQPSETYLTFQIGFQNIPFDHYYRLFNVEGPGQLAVTFTGTPTGDTCLVAFLNVKRTNKAFLVITLDKLFSGESASGVLVSKGAMSAIDVSNSFSLESFVTGGHFIDKLPRNLYDLFQTIL